MLVIILDGLIVFKNMTHMLIKFSLLQIHQHIIIALPTFLRKKYFQDFSKHNKYIKF